MRAGIAIIDGSSAPSSNSKCPAVKANVHPCHANEATSPGRRLRNMRPGPLTHSFVYSQADAPSSARNVSATVVRFSYGVPEQQISSPMNTPKAVPSARRGATLSVRFLGQERDQYTSLKYPSMRVPARSHPSCPARPIYRSHVQSMPPQHNREE